MRLDQLFKVVEENFPLGHIVADMEEEVVIYTGFMYERPLGSTGGPQNVQPDHRQFVELREMNEGDLPDVAV